MWIPMKFIRENLISKDRGMCYPAYGMVHIKDPLLIEMNSPCSGGSGFPLSLSEWSDAP